MWAGEIGSEFSVDITVDLVENLWAYQFWLSFDPTHIQGVSVENGPFLGKDTDSRRHPVMVVPGPGFDNEAGELKLFGAFIYFESRPPRNQYLADGGGVLATVTFEVISYGTSNIELGSDTKLSDKYADEIPSNLADCFLTTSETTPELYIRRRGAEGASGIWEEWQVGDYGTMQTLYCRVLNYGSLGAEVKVKIIARDEFGGLTILETNADSIDPAIDVGEPSEVTVSVSFYPMMPGKYWCYGILLYKAGPITEWTEYFLHESGLGGEGLSRDVNVGFFVKI
jgi:hypothetical protein